MCVVHWCVYVCVSINKDAHAGSQLITVSQSSVSKKRDGHIENLVTFDLLLSQDFEQSSLSQFDILFSVFT